MVEQALQDRIGVALPAYVLGHLPYARPPLVRVEDELDPAVCGEQDDIPVA
jgi:hypothetical protein